MGATTEGEEMNSGSTEPERIKPTEETCEFEENNMSLPQVADCDTGIQDQKPADGTFPMCNMPQRPTSNALNTDNKETEEQHRNAWDSALSASSQGPLPHTMDDTSEPIQGTLEVLQTDTPVDLEESVARPTPAEIMELLDKQQMNDDWDAIFETLQKEMQLGDSDIIKQDLHINPDVDLLNEEGYTPLYQAALNGHFERVDDLISQGANPDKPSKGGLTPLHAAAQEGHEDIVDYLILQGADVNVECERGRTPLHTSAKNGHTNIMDSFLAEGTDVCKKDNTGQTPFLAAVHYGQIKAVNYLTANGAKQNKFDGMTSLYIAAQSDHLDMVELLISQGADVNEDNDSGQVPLHTAASRGHLDVINFLVDHGADVNKAAVSGWTPFHAAISNGSLDVVKYLRANGSRMTRFDGMTSLYIAARAGHLDVVRFLISQGHSVNELNKSGHTPLHGAVFKGHSEVTEYLIRQGADKNIRKGWTQSQATRRNYQADVVEYVYTEHTEKAKFYPEKTALYIAAESGHRELVEDCISKGSQVNEKNTMGEVPLHAAARIGSRDITKYLILQGANVNETDHQGTTPLLAAIKNGHVDVAKYLKKVGAKESRIGGMSQIYIAAQSGHLDMVKFLIYQGAGVNEENDSGQVPLHGACSRGHFEVIKFLVGHGADVNKKTKSGWTPFLAAISNGRLDVVKYLLANGALVLRFDGMTPLYIAARAGHLGVVQFLISQRHDVNELNSSGHSPLHGAAVRGRFEVMEYLIRQGADTGKKRISSHAMEKEYQVRLIEHIHKVGLPEYRGMSILYIAVLSGRLEVVEEFIEKGAHVNGTNSNGEVPLHAAARNGHLDITKYLIHQGANLKKEDDMGTTPYLAAIHRGHLEVVKYLKTKGAQETRIHGMTPLYIAAQSGHLDIVQFLISKEADVNEQNDSGQVPLHAAADEGHLEVLQFLVKHEANVNKETITGSTPFFRAVSNGQLEAVKYLRAMGACMTRCLGMTPLYIAAQNGHSEVVKFLIKEEVDVDDGSISGRSPLHAASFSGNLDIVSSLVNARANVNAKDGDDWTPLHAAAQEGHTNVITYLINNGADINAKDAEGFSPHLLPNPGCRHSSEYQTSYGDEPLDKVSQKAIIYSGSCQDQGENTKSLEVASCEIIKGDEEQFSGSGVKALLQTALHRDDTVKHQQDNLSNLDPVKRGNRYALSRSAEEETNTITTNYETPADTIEKKEEDISPFARAKSKCPVNKAHTSLSLETKSSSHIQLDTKYASSALQHGSFKWKRRQVKTPFPHLTEKTAHQEETHVQSGRGKRREDNRKMKVPSLIKFRGNTGQRLKDDLTEDMSAGKHGKMRTEALQDQISPEDCTPTIDSISAGSTRDSKNKHRTPDRRFPPSLLLLQIFIRMFVVAAIFQTGRPVLAGGSPRSEAVTLQAGKSGVVPFFIPRPADNTSQITAYYTLRFESKQRPFYINGKRDIEGFKSPSQITRFEIIMTEMTTFYSVNLNVNSVDTVDQDIYILTLIFHGLENVLVDMLTKEVLVNIPPGPAQCFITLSESSNYPYEVHCQATTGNVETTLTCYQNSQSVEVKGEITNNGQVTRGVFSLPHNTHFSCCSHNVNFRVNEKICNDFEWPPGKHSTVPPTVIHPSLTPSVANTIVAIGNTDEQASKTLLESQVDSGSIKHSMVPSVSLTLGLMIYLFLC